MSVAAPLPLSPHDISTTLNYYAPLGDDVPYIYAYEAPDGRPRTNVGTDPHPVVIHDARGNEADYSLDKTGFAFVKYPSAEKDFIDEEAIRSVYYKEVEELLKKETGAKRVHIFDHTIRWVTVAAALHDLLLIGSIQGVLLKTCAPKTMTLVDPL